MQILIYTTLFRVHLRIAEDFVAVLALISTENELNLLYSRYSRYSRYSAVLPLLPRIRILY